MKDPIYLESLNLLSNLQIIWRRFKFKTMMSLIQVQLSLSLALLSYFNDDNNANDNTIRVFVIKPVCHHHIIYTVCHLQLLKLRWERPNNQSLVGSPSPFWPFSQSERCEGDREGDVHPSSLSSLFLSLSSSSSSSPPS